MQPRPSPRALSTLWVALALGIGCGWTGCAPDAPHSLQEQQEADRLLQESSAEAADFDLRIHAGATVLGTFSTSELALRGLRAELVDPPQDGIVCFSAAGAGHLSYRHTAPQVRADRFSYRLVRQDGSSRQPRVGTVLLRPAAAGIHGQLTYDFVPTALARQIPYLDYAHLGSRPIRGARVQLIGATAAVVAQTVSDANGAYSFAWQPGAAAASVRVLSSAFSPAVEVVDNTQQNVSYALQSSPSPTPDAAIGLHAPSGWEESSYVAPRSAAPFAVLDAAVGAAQAFAQPRPQIEFSPLRINWSEHNVPQPGDPSLGLIGTSHWNGQALYVLGHADIDTDEYDTAVLLHEWAHYFEATHSRSDSPGGPHTPGAALDLRLAFSEGLGNAVSALLLAPRTFYADTAGQQQGQGFSFDLIDAPWTDPTPSFASEIAIHSLLFDLFGPSAVVRPWETLGLGLGVLYDVLHGPQAATPARTSIFSFVTGLKQQPTVGPAAIDAVAEHYGLVPIDEPYGTVLLAQHPAGPGSAWGKPAPALTVSADVHSAGATVGLCCEAGAEHLEVQLRGVDGLRLEAPVRQLHDRRCGPGERLSLSVGFADPAPVGNLVVQVEGIFSGAHKQVVRSFRVGLPAVPDAPHGVKPRRQLARQTLHFLPAAQKVGQ